MTTTAQNMFTDAEVAPRRMEQSPLLWAEGLSKSFGGQTVLENVSLELRRGEVVLLRGANGSGKTTLLNILTGNLEPDAGTLHLSIGSNERAFRFPRTWGQRLNPLDRFAPEQIARPGVGRTWQDIRLFSTRSLRDNIAVAMPDQLGENPLWSLVRRRAVGREEEEHRNVAVEALESLGLKGRESSSADMVSLGQAKRVAIARAVHANARILLLDEPLGGLDSPGVADVLQLLKRLARESEITLVIVEHAFNIPHVLDFATTVWTLERNQITVEDPADVRTSIDFSNQADVQNWIQTLAGPAGDITNESLSEGAVLTTITPEDVELGGEVLDIEDLAVFRGRRLVIGERGESSEIRGLTFTLREGQIAVLQAPNGWGKTTLLEAIAGTLPVEHGTIRIRGETVDSLPAWERDVTLLQAEDHVFPSLTVQEAMKLAQVEPIPTYVEPLIGKQVADLSGGEKQRVALACAVEGDNSSVRMFDEPYSALDPEGLHSFERILEQSNKGVSLIALPSTIN